MILHKYARNLVHDFQYTFYQVFHQQIIFTKKKHPNSQENNNQCYTLAHKSFDQVEQHEEYIIVALLIYFSILPEKKVFQTRRNIIY
jgi:hypothetical protein